MARTPKASPAQKSKMEKTMGEYKEGELHSGSKTGPKVEKRSQAIAIGLKQAGLSRKAPSKRMSK